MIYYSDEETRREEENFPQKVADARAYFEENKQRFDEFKAFMETVLLPITQKEFPTPEEIELLFKYEPIANEMMQKLDEMMGVIGENLMRNVSVIMEQAKEKSEEGVEGAKEAYSDLNETYLKIIEANISKN